MANTNKKARNWFIEVNQKAQCYNENLKELEKIIKENFNYKQYAIILHDKDVLENGDLKTKHIHIVLELENAITFQSVQKKLLGAHIEIANNINYCYAYLVHESPNSKEKYNYNSNNIISNNLDLVKRYITDISNVEPFNQSLFITYIARGIKDIYKFTKIFGFDITKKYWKVYQLLIEESYKNEEMKEDIEKAKIELEAENLPF